MEFEKEFNIDIPDEDAEKLRTVGDAIAYLNEKVGGVMKRRVVVTGLGCHHARRQRRGDDLAALLAGRPGPAPITKFDATNFPGALRVRGEGLRPAAVHGPQGSEARRPVHAVRGRRVGAGDAGRRASPTATATIRTAPASSSAAGIGGLKSFEEQHDVYRERGPSKISPVLHPDVHRRHRGRHRLDALQRARARTTPPSRRARRARTPSATRSAPSSTATPTS